MKKITYLLILVLLIGTFSSTAIAQSKYDLQLKKFYKKNVNVKIKEVNKKKIVFNIKNRSTNRLFSGIGTRLYIYKNKKWKLIPILSPKTILLDPREKNIYPIKWKDFIIKKNNLRKKKYLKKGKYKVYAYYRKFIFKIKK